MASISKAADGKRTIQFVGVDKKRHSIRLGKMPKQVVESVKSYVERILSCNIAGVPYDAELARWVATLEPSLHGKLANVGLVEARHVNKLGEFVTGYIELRTDLKQGTIRHLKRAAKALKDHFGPDREISTITAADAQAWRLALLKGSGTSGWAENTVRRITGRAKQFFVNAQQAELITKNPFAGLPCMVTANRSRDFFVSPEMAERVLEACPSLEWRVIFVLCRFGGLRCPSEVLALRWADILWNEEKLRVRSSKLEKYADKAERLIPLFPEIERELRSAQAVSEVGEFVVKRTRDASTNFRTGLSKIIRRAGYKPWGKLFQNLRASRATELAETFPGHVCASWLGHSEKVADAHYRQTLETHFKRAMEKQSNEIGAAESGAFVVQNQGQQANATSCKSWQESPQPTVVNHFMPFVTTTCDVMQIGGLTPSGLEPETPGLKVRCSTN